jgi:hypothetical protein
MHLHKGIREYSTGSYFSLVLQGGGGGGGVAQTKGADPRTPPPLPESAELTQWSLQLIHYSENSKHFFALTKLKCNPH